MTKEEIQYEAQSIIQEWGSNDSAPYVEFVEKLASMELPESFSNLDEAAHSYAWEKQEHHIDFDGDEYLDYGPRYDAFKAGAEWMAGQGFISEGIINQTSGEDTIIELNEHIGYLEDCEEVIVNVRKKQ